MKYHDSVKEADQKLTLSVKQMRIWDVPASPINYAVAYEYVNNKKTELIKAIGQQLSAGKTLDSFFMEELYQQYVLGQSKFRDNIIGDIEKVLDNVDDSRAKSSASLNGFVSVFDANIGKVQSNDKLKAQKAIQSLRQASQKLKQQQLALLKQLEVSKQHTSALKVELEETRKEVYLDPLTRFYNKKAMSQQLDVWFTEDPAREVAAIVVNVDHFSQFNHKFGPLISDVLLSKIAQKVGSYIDGSGVGVRSGGDEFVILFPDLDKGNAQEIATKIQQGVEKLRFVSSKSGVRLPQMTVSVGVGQYGVAEKSGDIIKKIRQMLSLATENQHNEFTPSFG